MRICSAFILYDQSEVVVENLHLAILQKSKN